VSAEILINNSEPIIKDIVFIDDYILFIVEPFAIQESFLVI